MPGPIPAKVSLNGAASTARVIASLLGEDDECRSGVFGVTDQLEIVSVQTFHHGLRAIDLRPAIKEILLTRSTGVLAFDVVSDNPLFVEQKLISNLVASCEGAGAILLDVLLYSPSGWASLRQQNLL